eukprot:613383-Rhodomonas_salina.6
MHFAMRRVVLTELVVNGCRSSVWWRCSRWSRSSAYELPPPPLLDRCEDDDDDDAAKSAQCARVISIMRCPLTWSRIIIS